MNSFVKKKAWAKTIWRDVFQDADAFIELYFRYVYKDDATRLIVDYRNSVAVAHIQTLSYHIVYCNHLCKAGYISGAATRPQYRSYGIMPKLMKSALVRMYQRGDFFSFLIPAKEWLYTYYQEKAGYASVGRRIVQERSPKNVSSLSNNVFVTDDVEQYKRFRRMRSRKWSFLYVAHSYQQWRTILLDAALSSGGMNEVAIVRHLGATTQWVLTDTSSSSENLNTGEATIQLVAPPNYLPESITQKHGMLRIVRAKEVLQLYARHNPCVDRTFDLLDKEIAVNTGRYKVTKGNLLFTPLPPCRLSPNALSISELTEQLFSSFYIDLMLD